MDKWLKIEKYYQFESKIQSKKIINSQISHKRLKELFIQAPDYL